MGLLLWYSKGSLKFGEKQVGAEETIREKKKVYTGTLYTGVI
ncbi:hypothetical protein F400_gp132 [Bacillus phage BCD7]|uniref:Uncharacterized protein n=1 Tax=Bacillus phage BCD7 TaxID=1136534 RepID=J9PVB3_9CAUD|nr:hypothetical protein F400_gp132 [Bacillus phage BCD7]AEZ50579.1 hypothetical protein BCD7_0132 [Bacillus phage BCD7]